MPCSRNQNQRISDVICKLAPYLKMYSEYTNNYNKACKVFDELRRKNKRFAHVVAEVELLPECENLPLQSHLICPVQRVARYHLLLKGSIILEYHKNLPDNHPDQRDAESALEKVKVAASHANDMMKKLDKYRDVIEIQEQLGNQLQGLVTPCRELVKKGRLTKISGRSGDKQDRMLFLFNDLLLLCSDRSVPFSKYKLRTVFQLDELTLLEGDDLEHEYSFHLRSKTKRVKLGAKSISEKSEWLETLWSCIKSYRIRKDSFNTLPSPTNSLGADFSDSCDSSPGVRKCCSKCKSSFRFLNREVSCSICELPMCKKCVKKSPCDNLISSDNKLKQIVCLDCAENAYLNRRTITQPQNDEKKELKFSEPVKPTDDCVLNGYLDFRNAKTSQWSTRYFALRADYVLYCFRDIKDDNARSSLILPGCEVALIDPKTDASVFSRQANNLIFKLIRPNVTYYFRANNENDSAQ
uniref:Uncharacterized protein n=1 Tax=Romanomermis culicivorax TaxID=13658 RepID=A0A915HTZ9_ROMCU